MMFGEDRKTEELEWINSRRIVSKPYGFWILKETLEVTNTIKILLVLLDTT